MFWNCSLPKWVKKMVSIRDVDINITSKTVTINGKQHVCKKDLCPVCEEATNILDEASNTVDAAIKHVDKIVEEENDIVYNQDQELLNWEAFVAPLPSKYSGKLKIQLKYGGSSKPLPDDCSWLD